MRTINNPLQKENDLCNQLFLTIITEIQELVKDEEDFDSFTLFINLGLKIAFFPYGFAIEAGEQSQFKDMIQAAVDDYMVILYEKFKAEEN